MHLTEFWSLEIGYTMLSYITFKIWFDLCTKLASFKFKSLLKRIDTKSSRLNSKPYEMHMHDNIFNRSTFLITVSPSPPPPTVGWIFGSRSTAGESILGYCYHVTLHSIRQIEMNFFLFIFLWMYEFRCNFFMILYLILY